MDLRQLAALTAVGDHRSFSAAARSLHTVQSNVSAHVAKLEDELGVILVDRSDGSFTEAGELVAARARRIEAELDALGSDLASSEQSITGPVRLGMIGTTARWLIPLLLPAIAQQHPGIQLTIIDATTTSLIPQLLTRRLDVAVINLPVHSQDVSAEPLFEEHHVLIAPLDHPLSHLDEVGLTELSRHPLLLPPPGTSFRDELDLAIARFGVRLESAAEVDGVRLLATLAFEGFGAAIVPASAASRRSGSGWKRIGITGLAPRGVGLATERRALLSNAARAVRASVLEICREHAASYVEITPVAGPVERSTHHGK
ncbi:MAG TPA: LysR family transcriptional regulator [Acidimicrobiales bacterium]|nr:LysR family transcriptional regulator [Acidimicrobiales bacterium]